MSIEEFEKPERRFVTQSPDQGQDLKIDGEIVPINRREKAASFLENTQFLNVLEIDPIVLENVPVLFVDQRFKTSRGGYSPDHHIILMPLNTDHNPVKEQQIIEHEIMHALLVRFINSHDISKLEFQEMYNYLKESVTEDDVTLDGLTSFNFIKNVHEFIADAITLPNMIQALKNHGLYEEVLGWIQSFIDGAREDFLEEQKGK